IVGEPRAGVRRALLSPKGGSYVFARHLSDWTGHLYCRSGVWSSFASCAREVDWGWLGGVGWVGRFDGSHQNPTARFFGQLREKNYSVPAQSGAFNTKRGCPISPEE